MGYLLENVKNHVLKSKQEYCTWDYGTREPDYADHHGIDIINNAGGACDVIAIADGEVVRIQDGISGYDEVYSAGNFVRIKHPNGIYTRYLHMVNGSICVKVGQKVKAGDKLGVEGNTGYSFGTHLHFDVNDGTNYVDPLPYLLGQKSFGIDKSTETEEQTTSNIVVGSKVTVNNGAKFSDGTKPFDHVYKTTYTVQQLSRDGTEALIGINKILVGWMYIKDLSIVGNSTVKKTSLKVGDTVKVKAGATTYGGKKLAAFVYTEKYTVMQVGKSDADDYIVIGQNGMITAAVKADDLILL